MNFSNNERTGCGFENNKLSKNDYQELLDMLRRRQNTIKKLGYSGLQNCFDYGQRVGFFFGKGDGDFSFGELVDSDERTASILADDGRRYVVSPFSLFPIK